MVNSAYAWLSMVISDYQLLRMVISCYTWCNNCMVYMAISGYMDGYQWLYAWLSMVIRGYAQLVVFKVSGYQALSDVFYEQ